MRKVVFENGEKWERTPDLCKKCGSELKHDFREEGRFEIWETTCSNCSYRKVEKTDREKEKLKKKQELNHEKELLDKYRSRFCIEKEKAEEFIEAIEELKFADQVYEYELQKLDTPEYEQTHNIQKLSAVEVEELLNKILRKSRFDRFTMKEPEFGKFVEIIFSIQDLDKSRNQKESTQAFGDLLKETLKTTNWRLMDSISYRLGFLTARLRGYEQDEDILKLFMKKKAKPQPKVELDPEKMKKYDQANAVKLARMSAEFEATKRIRMKRYKSEPDGFLLENHGDSCYSCNLCGKSIKGNETWWIPEAILCLNCNRNLKEGVFPIEIFENHKLYFRIWDVEQEFGMYSATVRKHIRNGDLVARELKTAEGKTYDLILMSEDNVEFFKTHPRKREREQRWHYVDGEGRVVWL